MSVIFEFPLTGERLEVDAAFSIRNQRSAQITEHPIEGGGNRSDHRDRRPIVITVSGVVSDVQIGRVEGAYDPEATGYHTQFLSRIEEADENNEEIVVDLGKRGIYIGMLISELAIDWDSKSSFSIPFDITLQEVASAETQVIALEQTGGTAEQPRKLAPVDEVTRQRWSELENQGNAAITNANAGLADLTNSLAESPYFGTVGWAR